MRKGLGWRHADRRLDAAQGTTEEGDVGRHDSVGKDQTSMAGFWQWRVQQRCSREATLGSQAGKCLCALSSILPSVVSDVQHTTLGLPNLWMSHSCPSFALYVHVHFLCILCNQVPQIGMLLPESIAKLETGGDN